MAVKIKTSLCESYWIPIPKNAVFSVNAIVGPCATYDVPVGNGMVWAIVRHPAARLYSCWLDKVARADTFLHGVFNNTPITVGSSFAQFVDFVCDTDDSCNDHFRSQTAIIDAETECDLRIIHLERIRTDWPLLAREVGLPPKLPQLNSIRTNPDNHDTWREAYTKELFYDVKQRFFADFVRLDYK